MRTIFLRHLVSPLTEIELLKNGFSVRKPFGAKLKVFYWREIQNVRFSKNYEAITIEKNNKKFLLKNDTIGWYELIQNVPVKFTEFDFDYVKNFMDSLKPCGICGIIAIRETKCLVCDTIEWNGKMLLNKTEYLKSKQSEFYSDDIKNGRKLGKIAKPEHGFKANNDWELYI